jgi:hypothetical protein
MYTSANEANGATYVPPFVGKTVRNSEKRDYPVTRDERLVVLT